MRCNDGQGSAASGRNEMAGRFSAIAAVAAALLSALPPSRVSAQAPPPQRPPVDLVCCYQEKPRCEGTCPVTDAEQREDCMRDCEGRLRTCLAQGVFAPKRGQEVPCVKRPGQPG
jgi:hypothetical protein